MLLVMSTHRRELAGLVIGTAGGGLTNASWAANETVARLGQKGEVRTAELLDELAVEYPVAVLHDVRIPIPGFTANIDHVVVAGHRVLLIDSKVWKPGRYWTIGGRTRRGWSTFEHAATKTPGMAHDTIGRFLTQRGAQHQMLTPLVAIWPSSSKGSVSTQLLRMDRCRPVSAARIASLSRKLAGKAAADPAIVAALSDLVNGSPTPSRTAQGRAAADSAPAFTPAGFVPDGPTHDANGMPIGTSPTTGLYGAGPDLESLIPETLLPDTAGHQVQHPGQPRLPDQRQVPGQGQGWDF